MIAPRCGQASITREHCQQCPVSFNACSFKAVNLKSRKHKFNVVDVKERTLDGIVFRSGLECNVAKLLTSLKIAWSYEPTRLELVYNKTLIAYTPDFLVNLDNKYSWLECKGHLLPDGKVKLLAYLFNLKFVKHTSSDSFFPLFVLTKPDLSKLETLQDYLRKHIKRLPAWFKQI